MIKAENNNSNVGETELDGDNFFKNYVVLVFLPFILLFYPTFIIWYTLIRQRNTPDSHRIDLLLGENLFPNDFSFKLDPGQTLGSIIFAIFLFFVYLVVIQPLLLLSGAILLALYPLFFGGIFVNLYKATIGSHREYIPIDPAFYIGYGLRRV